MNLKELLKKNVDFLILKLINNCSRLIASFEPVKTGLPNVNTIAKFSLSIPSNRNKKLTKCHINNQPCLHETTNCKKLGQGSVNVKIIPRTFRENKKDATW